jgi:glycosyltransferase involved in cell wall biosynthesis
MAAAGISQLGFVTWDRDTPTGGTVYDQNLVTELRALGIAVRLHQLAGPWPETDASTQANLAQSLRAQPACLVDGILAGASPEVVAAAVESGHAVTLVVHLPISDELGLDPARRERYAALEGQAVRAASGVVCPSHWCAAELRQRYGRSDLGVAIPGVTPAPAAPGSQHSGGAPRLLTLASLTPTKDQLTLVRAFARLTDLAWSADLVGFDVADPGYAARVRHEVAEAGLKDRISVTGALTGSALDQRWDAADLLVLPSRVETFGLVVTEALARGIPAIVSAGTGAVEALQQGATVPTDAVQGTAGPTDAMPGTAGPTDAMPGTAVPPGDPTALAAVLRRWLTEPTLRRAWQQSALARRGNLPGWQRTAEAVLSYLERPQQPLSTPTGSPPALPPMTPPVPPRPAPSFRS